MATVPRQSLAQQCTWRRFEPDQRIISRNGTDRDVHLTVSGMVRITVCSAAGRQVTFTDEGPGAVFGELAAIDGQPRTADVVALQSSLIASMPAVVFRQLLGDEPIVMDRVLLRLTTLVRKLSDRVIDLSTLGVQNRVHAELLRLARKAGVQRQPCADRSRAQACGYREPRQYLPRAGDAGVVRAGQIKASCPKTPARFWFWTLAGSNGW